MVKGFADLLPAPIRARLKAQALLPVDGRQTRWEAGEDQAEEKDTVRVRNVAEFARFSDRLGAIFNA